MSDPLFEEWRAYQKMVEGDYMGHTRFFQRLYEEAAARFRQPLAILDLGCGDTTPIQALLRKIQVSDYCGIDVSETALNHAGDLLASCVLSHKLIAGDILETVRDLDDSFDLIIASFSLHHLPDPASKQALLAQCRRILRPEGFVAVIDVFLGEHESRDDYLDRFERQARENYFSLTDKEMTTLITHVRSSDFPESVDSYRDFGQQAGFNQVRSLLLDEISQHQLIIIETT